MTPSNAARRWVVANMVPTAFAAVATLMVYVIGLAMGLPGHGASLPAQTLYVALHTAVLAAGLTLYAQMTGPVLAANIPRFPHRAWTALHLTLGLVAGFLSGLAMLDTQSVEPLDWSDTGEAVQLMLFLLALSAVAGLAFGGLQALVLRRAAQGMGLWIGCWVLVLIVAAPLAALVDALVPDVRSLKHELVAAVVTLIVGLIGSLMLLPAVRRLRPKF